MAKRGDRGDRPTKDFAQVTDHLKRISTQLPKPEAKHILTVQEQIEAISRGDFETSLSQARHDLELEIFAPADFPFVRRARGIRNVRRAIEHNFNSLQDQRPTVDNVMVQGDLVVIIGSETGQIRKTGTLYDIQFVHRFTFADGGLTHVQVIAARRT